MDTIVLPDTLPATPGHDVSAGIDLWGRSGAPEAVRRWVFDQPEVKDAIAQATTVLRGCFADPSKALDAAIALMPPAAAQVPLSVIDRAAHQLGAQVGSNPGSLGTLRSSSTTDGLKRQLLALPSTVTFLLANLMRLHADRHRAVEQQLQRDERGIPDLDREAIQFIGKILKQGPQQVALWHAPASAPLVDHLRRFLGCVSGRLGVVEPKTYLKAADDWARQFAVAGSGFEAEDMPVLRQALRLREQLVPVVSFFSNSI